MNAELPPPWGRGGRGGGRGYGAEVGGFFLVTEKPLTGKQKELVGISLSMTRFILQVRPLAEGDETRTARNEIRAAQGSGIILPKGIQQ